MSMSGAITHWLARHRGFRVGIQTTVVAVSSYFGGLLTKYIASTDATGAGFYISISGGFITVFIITLFAVLVDRLTRGAEDSLRREHNIHRLGYNNLSGEITALTKAVREFSTTGRQLYHEHAIAIMKRSVSDLYNILELEYGENESLDNRIEFEVTFMTKSLRDSNITIAAWENRDRRAPKSLSMRKENPDIYVDTETDKIYRDPNKTVRVIENTSTSEYKELYQGQKNRIKSSIVYPVLDDESHLVGTIVIHCDRTNYFVHSRIRFWRELLEPYTKRLALARIISDIVASKSGQGDPPF
jgi:hypothetical protein